MSTLGPLVSVDDLADYMSAPITDAARAVSLLNAASAAVRVWCRQEFSRRESTERVRAQQGRITLRERPVHSITTVATVSGSVVPYTWEGIDGLDVGYGSIWSANGPYGSRFDRVLDVTYDHGYDAEDMPAEITAVVLQCAGRAYGLPVEESALLKVAVDGYEEQRHQNMLSGPLALEQPERDLLAAAGYRRTATTLQLSGPDYRYNMDRYW